jgi:hypothetical protein
MREVWRRGEVLIGEILPITHFVRFAGGIKLLATRQSTKRLD